MIAELLLSALLAQEPPAKPEPPKPAPTMTEAQRLRVENLTLREALFQLQVRTTRETLDKLRAEIDAEIRQAHPGYTLDWQTGALIKAQDTPTEP